MLRYIFARELSIYPKLHDSMFRDRADQFKTRLNWDVKIDENGFERNEYDDLNPLYVIWETKSGRQVIPPFLMGSACRTTRPFSVS
jgi:acyl homoserine lactone synthase